MKKNLAKFVLTVYVLSTAIFYAVIPKAEMGEGLAAVFAEKKTKGSGAQRKRWGNYL